ncbi:protein kinase [Gordonia sp. VNQ95]|uniref:serine/threonine-protein kinase n=1 Tax=Gordonia sp. VNQ95 TaxID=3156619 RepID=UPI0032B47360
MVYTPGDAFAGYTIERLVGRGGMGEVYLARHPKLPRKEAVKILPADLSRDPMFRQRFIREAELASSMVHPAIVTIYNSGEDDGHLWLAMEFIDGVDGSELLRRHPRGLDPALVSAIAMSVASALDAAHARGLLHRDVKPANILVQGADGAGATRIGRQPPRVLLADFGIAKSTADVTNLTSANMFLGTVAYVAPEQLLGTEVDGRADQYSLAATLFQLLCGVPPFEGSTQTSVIAAHLNSDPPALSGLRPGTSNAVDEVLRRGLGKTADERYPSCSDLAADLDRALRGAQSGPPQSGPPPGPTEIIPARASAPPSTSVPPSYAQPIPSSQVPPVPAGPYTGASYPGAVAPGSIPPYGPPSAPLPVGSYPSQPGGTGGYPLPPTPRRGSSSKTALAVLGALLALVLVIVAGVWVANLLSGSDSGTSTAAGNSVTTTAVAGTPTSTPFTRPPVTEQPTQISGPGQIAVGDCVQIGRQPDSAGNVDTSRVDCATSAMTFYAAEFVAASAECPNDHNASLSFGGTAQKLCLAPNFTPGQCYQIPSSGGSLADYHELSCGAAAAAGTVAFRITNRSTSAVSCATGELRWIFAQPESLGYCLTQESGS